MAAVLSRMLEALRTLGGRGDSVRPIPVDEVQFGVNSARRILVVDDAAQIVRLMQINLERAGFIVDDAMSVGEAQVKIAANVPDVVVTDAMMPETDGFELLQRIRCDPATANIPVVILAPWTKEGDKDYCFTKPFHPKDLVALVERICRKL